MIEPLTDKSVTQPYSFTELISHAENLFEIEEDILVPDTKHDVETILFLDGIPAFEVKDTYMAGGDRNIGIAGNIDICIMYLPETDSNEITPIRSQIKVKREIKAEDSLRGGESEFEVSSKIEKLEAEIINERKIRIKAVIKLDICEYCARDLVLLDRIDDSEMEILREETQITDVAARKKDVIEIRENVRLRDGLPPVRSVLKADLKVSELNRQITGNKLMINSVLECSVLYKANNEDGIPETFRTKVDFSQFIKLREGEIPENSSDALINISHTILSDQIIPISSNNDMADEFEINADIEVSVEIFRNIEVQVVSDVYHRSREIAFEKRQLRLMNLKNIKSYETTVRDTVYPEDISELRKVIYINAEVHDVSVGLPDEKYEISGLIDIYGAVAYRDDSGTQNRSPGRSRTRDTDRNHEEVRGIKSISHTIPLSTYFDSRGTSPGDEVRYYAYIKDLRYEIINTRQIEVSITVGIQISQYHPGVNNIIENVCFIGNKHEDTPHPGYVLYITSDEDTPWSIGALFKTGTENIMDVKTKDYLHASPTTKLSPGKKLLIVK